jgi:ATP-dependent helicase HrpB
VLQAGLLSAENPNLVMLQPRRVAARFAARRIAEEQHLTLGRQVGYHVRFERHLSQETRLRILTEGILARQLLDDPYLPGVGCVVLDEFHERSLYSDLAIAMLRELRQSVRPDLILIVMSATLDAEPISAFLGGVPIIDVPGRRFAIEIEYRGMTGGRIEQKTADAVRDALANPGGDVLVFLPGAEEIRRTRSELNDVRSADVFPLYGSLPAVEQDRALSDTGRRKVILATNIAETSLTIPGVDVVIDTGLERLPMYDANRGMDRLELRRISKASASQRAGRAGRTGPGRCVRLWTAKEQQTLDDFAPAEVDRVDLSSAVLSLHAWGAGDVGRFDWFERPSEQAIAGAENLLQMLGAVEPRGTGGFQMTELGRRMLGLPIPVRLARLLIDAHQLGLGRAAADIAAILSERDVVQAPAETSGDSDLLERRRFLCRQNPAAARRIAQISNQLLRWMPAASEKRDVDERQLLKLVLLAYPDRVVRRRATDASAGMMVGGVGVRLAAESVVRRGEFFVAVDVQADQRSRKSESLVRMASRIERSWLSELFPRSISTENQLIFDEPRQKVLERKLTRYRDLIIEENDDSPGNRMAAGAVLGEALRQRGKEFFEIDEPARQWLARLALLRRAMPEHPWPNLDDEQLGELLVAAAHGRRNVREMDSPADLLRATLAYPLDRLFETHAPSVIVVPSGNRIAIDYIAANGPVLAVRLQELFGLNQTPSVCAGRVPLVLHLLGPNFRPVQITNDLASFWQTAYFQVRKDLKARYPKHSWPEDPLAAAPQAKGRRRLT